MAEGKIYKVDITKPAKSSYQAIILPYIFENFSLERALEIDDNILNKAQTLDKKPNRGTKEKYLREAE